MGVCICQNSMSYLVLVCVFLFINLHYDLYLNKFDFMKRFIEYLLDARLVNCEERMNQEEAVVDNQGNEKEGDPEFRWRGLAWPMQ